MASCEKYWADSNSNPDLYRNLIATRNCTPEEQAGPDAEACPKCGRLAIHIYCHECMNCGFKSKNSESEL